MSCANSPSILDYKDYRLFLRDFYQQKKEQNPLWSYASWAKSLGFNSHATLSMILSGNRNAGKKVVDAFARYFKFNQDEYVYFSKLVSIQKSVKDPTLSIVLVDKYLESARVEQTENIFNWLINIDTAILCELIRLPDFELSEEWLKTRLSYQLSMPLSQLVDKLLEYKIIAKDGDKKLRRVNNLSITDVPSEEQIRHFHQNSFNMASRAYDVVSPEDGVFGTLTFNIDRKDISRFREKIQELHRQLVEEFECETGNETTVVNYSFFPITRPPLS